MIRQPLLLEGVTTIRRAIPSGVVAAVLIALVTQLGSPVIAVEHAPADDDAIGLALERAGDNRVEIQRAIDEAPEEQREGMKFLITHMPERDLHSLSAKFLLSNVDHAYKTFEASPWKDAVPQEIFFNDVLPYASINERREDWRSDFHERFGELVAEAKTPAEAAAILNQNVFSMLNVRYSTQRKRADQSPYESIDSGLASCTGLTVLLIDACRSVGVPARFVGTPLWSDNSGNHSWVEVWDDGWHFTGAAEPTGDALDRAWFVGRASTAKRNDPRHAIYAVSYKSTPIHFPMVWDRDARYISAVNVTDRYTHQVEPLPEGFARVRFRVMDGKSRLTAKLKIFDADGNSVTEGETNDERFDANDHFTARLKLGSTYQAHLEEGGEGFTVDVTDFADEQLISIERNEDGWEPSEASQNIPSNDDSNEFASSEAGRKISSGTDSYFSLDPAERGDFKFDADLDSSLSSHPEAVRQLAWNSYRTGFESKELQENLEQDKVTWGDYTSPYVLKSVGERPDNGWPLFIAMHGGGGVPKEVNDQQWRHMQIYYRDQEAVEGYRYLALRAPTDAWNGFYTNYNLPLTDRLIKQFLIGGDIDPNRVFIMGYSHGGYGTWYIARHMPDRFAAAHASASAPSIGNGVGKNLRNTRYTYMFGERDTRYGRLERCQSFSQFMDELKALPENKDDYPVVAEYKEGFGHGGLPDRDKIKEMYEYQRNPVPKHVTWLPTNNEVKQFNWLEVEEVAGNPEIDAQFDENRLTIRTTNCEKLIVYVDHRLADLKQPLTVIVNGETRTVELTPSLQTMCETLASRGDPELAFSCRFEIEIP